MHLLIDFPLLKTIINIGFHSRDAYLSEPNSWQIGNGPWHVPKRGVCCPAPQGVFVHTQE